MVRDRSRLKLDWRSADRFICAVHSQEPVRGLTHDFYKYPARFSPHFCQATIDSFTCPGDMVADPFAGGGTSLVECRASGRLAVGTDISSLATFVSRVKTRTYSLSDLAYLADWFRDIDSMLDLRQKVPDSDWKHAGYFRNLTTSQTWPIRKSLEAGVWHASRIRNVKREEFVRCVLLRTAQWALDGRKKIPVAKEFRSRVAVTAQKMIEGAKIFSASARRADKLATAAGKSRSVCLQRRAEGLADYVEMTGRKSPKLWITSPPYPGVHILYHRWQVHGGKETPAPFWVANQLDGSGEAYYLMHARREGLNRYHEGIATAFTAARRIAEKDTVVVQMVAFSNPERQLSRYLEVMTSCGFEEWVLSEHIDSADGRLWRNVPRRKWHANSKGRLASGREVVLIHRPA